MATHKETKRFALTYEAFARSLSWRSRILEEGLSAFREKRAPRFEGR